MYSTYIISQPHNVNRDWHLGKLVLFWIISVIMRVTRFGVKVLYYKHIVLSAQVNLKDNSSYTLHQTLIELDINDHYPHGQCSTKYQFCCIHVYLKEMVRVTLLL